MKVELSKEKMMVAKELDIFIGEFLSELGKEKKGKKRKATARKVLLVFLGNYSCLVDGDTKAKCKELMLHFSQTINEMEKNENLDKATLRLVESMSRVMNMTEEKEEVVRPIMFKLVCLYAGLSVSDFTGTAKCHDLGKKLSSNWRKYTPIMVTLSRLMKQEKNSKLPISELALLEKYSFGLC